MTRAPNEYAGLSCMTEKGRLQVCYRPVRSMFGATPHIPKQFTLYRCYANYKPLPQSTVITDVKSSSIGYNDT